MGGTQNDPDALAEPEAFAAFYRRFERPVLAYFIRRTRDGELAVDLTAETFAGALAALRRGSGPTGAPGPWLFGIAYNKLADSARRGRVEDEARRALRMERIELDDATVDVVGALGAGRLDGIVAELPPEQREAVIARIVEEQDYAEIAAAMQCSELVARKRVSRGLRALRRLAIQENSK